MLARVRIVSRSFMAETEREMIWIGVDAHKRVHQGVALGPTGWLPRSRSRILQPVGPICEHGREHGPIVSGP